MSILSFIKEAGEKLFHHDTPPASSSADEIKAANDKASDAIMAYIEAQGLRATGLTVMYDGKTGTVTVYGVAPDQQTKEKIILCCGNVRNVASVNDQMTVDQSAPEAKYYAVVKGDNLSKISKQYYGDPNKYTKIFEANQPMLKSPDLIYPGQVLRIPPQ
ncbi:MAG TPA: peptidoglycan-binding protein LysM [Casimicrobiaceae bacterium]|jgi:nucleoid-associated protein YgaU|nr:peptidoglycan-binding protein LysM [Casimicrobiaceae bacterium]